MGEKKIVEDILQSVNYSIDTKKDGEIWKVILTSPDGKSVDFEGKTEDEAYKRLLEFIMPAIEFAVGFATFVEHFSTVIVIQQK